mmetsp:Transcript_8171/g.21685  ORF Transcript_8171/g.21685 Transcript_8171/m.21685 type:complete len:231 (-) Transcript_8171:1861-2553(-)
MSTYSVSIQMQPLQRVVAFQSRSQSGTPGIVDGVIVQTQVVQRTVSKKESGHTLGSFCRNTISLQVETHHVTGVRDGFKKNRNTLVPQLVPAQIQFPQHARGTEILDAHEDGVHPGLFILEVELPLLFSCFRIGRQGRHGGERGRHAEETQRKGAAGRSCLSLLCVAFFFLFLTRHLPKEESTQTDEEKSEFADRRCSCFVLFKVGGSEDPYPMVRGEWRRRKRKRYKKI